MKQFEYVGDKMNDLESLANEAADNIASYLMKIEWYDTEVIQSLIAKEILRAFVEMRQVSRETDTKEILKTHSCI